MAQTRMFRDRVVSMEQTLEGGEKHLPLLKALCREAFPELEYTNHALDHERDLFVMELEGPGGKRAKVAWTRMVLFDAERIPTLTGDPAPELRRKIVDFLRSRAGRPEIVVTFRHLEEGWVDTPEPRREAGGRRRRRGGRGGRQERGGGAASAVERRPAAQPPGRAPAPQGRAPAAARPVDSRLPVQPPRTGGETSGVAAPGEPGSGGGRRRRRFRRRGRGRGQGGPGGSTPSGGAAPPAPGTAP
jgi:hypothetical protein